MRVVSARDEREGRESWVSSRIEASKYRTLQPAAAEMIRHCSRNKQSVNWIQGGGDDDGGRLNSRKTKQSKHGEYAVA